MNNNKRAFTLIELLVVIAIIAILAAILFPVFAQAKAAAKKTASISNAKQQALATIMYSSDYDDVNVIYTSYALEGAAVAYGGSPVQPWSWLCQPYMKNADIFSDPQAPAIQPWGGTWSNVIQKAYQPVYGLNYTYLSAPYGLSNDVIFQPISTTSVANPAETVLLASKWSSGEDASTAPTNITWYGTPRGLIINYGVDSPHCDTLPMWCFGNWGSNSANFVFTLGDNNKEAAGVRTGGNSLRHGTQTIVAWTDGHVSSTSPGRLGQGSNWTRTTAASSVVINDVTKFLWDEK